jgi:hypothetical protein
MSSNPLLLEAIAKKKCVTAMYNRTLITLAPHILYTKFDATFIDAVVVLRDGTVPKETKLGAFNLAGLNDLALTDTDFQAHNMFNASAEKYTNVTLFSV